MTDAHNLRVLSDADAAADLAGLPRPSAQIAKIMALVERYSFLREHGTSAEYDKAGSAVEAALRDAPQQAEGWVMVPVEPTREMIDAYLKGTASGFYSARSDWANMLAARPSAPTAKPLFGEMIAQHPGLREEIAAESERADFEAAYRARYPVSCDLDPAKFNRSDVGDYEDIRVSIAWAMWQARASKGTP